MQESQSYLKGQNIVSLLSLAKRSGTRTESTGPHKVKMIKDAQGARNNPQTGEREEGIWYLMEENGQQVKYFVPFKDKSGEVHYLLQRLGAIPEGMEIILEYKKIAGSFKGYIDVGAIGNEEMPEEEIPENEEDESVVNVKDVPF